MVKKQNRRNLILLYIYLGEKLILLFQYGIVLYLHLSIVFASFVFCNNDEHN